MQKIPTRYFSQNPIGAKIMMKQIFIFWPLNYEQTANK